MWNDYYTPGCLSDALDVLQQLGSRARIIAGGTDMVLDFSSNRVPAAKALVDVSAIPELKGIRLEDGMVTIGAAETLTRVLQSPILRSQVPVLTEAVRTIAGPQVRNTATLGGNVVNASPAADTVPALLVLDADILISGPDNKSRSLPVEKFLLGVRKVDLLPGEIVTAFSFRLPNASARQYFRKVQPRHSMAIAMLNLAILVEVVDGYISDVRLSMGAVAPTALRLRGVEAALRAKPVSTALDSNTFTAVTSEILPITDFRASSSYRLRVAKNLLREAVSSLLEQPESIL
jgi:CO/xanthine dehydrogenase FAD-binding subunit